MKENQFMIEKLNVFNLFGTIFETKLAQFIVIISVVQFHVVCNEIPADDSSVSHLSFNRAQ